jgi:uncharacterized protein YccT (UPF0319 family)
MRYRALLLSIIAVSLLISCSVTGPVRFYSGPPRPLDQLAIVKVPAAITVRSIDGQKVKSPSMETGTYELQLEPGHHLIAFRYYLNWVTGDSGMMVASKDVGVDTVFEAGKTYEIRYKVPRNADEAYDFMTSFDATLVDLSSGQQYNSYEIQNLDTILAAKRLGVNATASQVGVPAATTTPAPTLSADAAVKEDPVKRLKFWWLMANEQQRKEFSQWMKTATESFAPAPTQTPDNTPPGTINGVKIKP